MLLSEEELGEGMNTGARLPRSLHHHLINMHLTSLGAKHYILQCWGDRKLGASSSLQGSKHQKKERGQPGVAPLENKTSKEKQQSAVIKMPHSGAKQAWV